MARKKKEIKKAVTQMRCYPETRKGLTIIAEKRGRTVPRELEQIVRRELQACGVDPETFGPLFARPAGAAPVAEDGLPAPEAPRTGLGMIP